MVNGNEHFAARYSLRLAVLVALLARRFLGLRIRQDISRVLRGRLCEFFFPPFFLCGVMGLAKRENIGDRADSVAGVTAWLSYSSSG